MKKLIFRLSAVACTAVCAISLCACNHKKEEAGESVNLGKPAVATRITDEERTASFKAFTDKTEDFASAFAEYAYTAYGGSDNFAVSPASVYMALSLAAECANGGTREEILSALGVTYGQLKENFPLYYRSLFSERIIDGKVTSALLPVNSVWVNSGAPVNSACIAALSDGYFCHSYSADFRYGNLSANAAVRSFVKEQTRGLIDKDFNLSAETLFALINTLYLKSVWNGYGDDMPFTDAAYGFVNSDGSVSAQKLLRADYCRGRAYEEQSFSTFYTSTYDGYKIKFILPKAGYSVDEVFTAENIKKANAAQYVYNDGPVHYETRCLFPEYKCGYDDEIRDILKEKFGINLLFGDGCDFSNLSPADCSCGSVRHVTALTVDKKGIEGAAVTVISTDTSVMPPNECVYEDFVLDRAFGFIITDPYNETLFSGVVNKV